MSSNARFASWMMPTDVTLTPVAEADFPVLRDLADTIWRQHYASIISPAQIGFMLTGRFNDAALRAQIRATGSWLELLRVAEKPAGYCGFEAVDTGSDGRKATAMKLGQLYVLGSHRGTGLGRFMLEHVEDRAREIGRRELWLQVNKRNAVAIGFYEAAGFKVVREAVFDIGSGFVMDDFVMGKQL